MSLYDTVKAQEANFPLPQPTATILVGTYNASADKFTYAVPTYTGIETDPPDPDRGGNLKPVKHTVTGGDVHAVNVFDLKLRFAVSNWQGDFVVSVQGQPAAHPAAGQNFVDVEAGTATTLNFSITCGGNEFIADLPLKIDRTLVAAGGITIPALPITILYAPPVDQQKKNIASWSSVDVAGTTTTVSISNQESTTSPGATPFAPWVTLATEMKLASQILAQVKDVPFIQGLATVLGILSGLIGSSTDTNNEAMTNLSQQALTVTLTTQDTVTTNPNGGGPGPADIIYYLKNARVCWYANGGPLQLALVGWDAVDAISVAVLKEPNNPTGLDQATLSALLQLDPFASGGSSAALPAPRFVLVDTFDINANHTYNISYTVTNTDLQQYTYTSVGVEDDTAGFFSWANIGVTQTLKGQATLTQTSATQTTATKTVTRQVQYYANPTEYYSVEVYCDVVFGTFAFRSVGTTAAPTLRGQLFDGHGQPLPLSEVSVISGGKRYKTTTDAEGNFSFRAAAIDTESVQVLTPGVKLTPIIERPIPIPIHRPILR